MAANAPVKAVVPLPSGLPANGLLLWLSTGSRWNATYPSAKTSTVHCQLVINTPRCNHPPQRLPPPLDNVQVMVIVWRLRGNIVRTAVCWIVWHNVHSQQHTYISSSYRSYTLGSSHWDPYAVPRGGCLEFISYITNICYGANEPELIGASHD